MKSLTLIAIAAIISSCGKSEKTASDYVRDTTALETLFPLLEGDQVTAIRHQDWCQVIGYKRGVFVHSTDGERPHPATRDATDFDPTAKSDLERIWKRIEASGTGVYIISDVKFNASGRVIHGEFDCGGNFIQQSYVFDPGYSLPTDLHNQRWHTKINNDWYFILEDWN
jgi:hypothetical protein